MPQTLVQKNGRWQLVGDDHSQDHTPPPPTPGPKPKALAKKALKPWWADPVHTVANELRYAGKQVLSLQGTQKPGTVQRNPWMAGVGNANPIARLITAAGAVSPVARQLQASGVYGAIQTAGEGLIALPQKILAPGKYADPRRSPPGRALNAFTRAGYKALGAKQPEDLTEGQRGVIDNQGRMAGIEIGTMPIGGAVGRRLAAGGASWASRGLRWGTTLGVIHGMGALLQDSTQGNMSNMVGALTGIDGVPLSVDPAKDDRVTAAVKSLIPNIVGGELLGLAGSAGARAVGDFGNIRRFQRAAGANTAHVSAGEKLKARGLVEDIEGQQRFTEQALQKPAPVPIPQTPNEARDAVLARWGRGAQQQPGVTPAGAPAGAPAEAPAAAPAATAPPSTAGQGFAPTTVRSTGPSQPWRDSFGGDGSQSPTIRSTGPSQAWREGPRTADGPERYVPSRPMAVGGPVLNPDAPLRQFDPGVDPWFPDEASYQEWLRRNASNALVPTTPSGGGPDVLPRQPVPPLDELRGEGLADPWGMGPDPNSPVQQQLAAKAAARAEPPAPAPAATEQSSAAPAAAAEEVTPLDPSAYDPALPEVADAQKLVSQLDPAELQAVAAVGADGGPVLRHIEEVIASRPAPQPREEISEAWAGVPTNSLSEIYLNGVGDLQPWSAQLDRLPATTLDELSHPDASPTLAQRIGDDTGKTWPFSREEVINGMQALSADGTTIVPNRLRGDIRTMRTEDIYAAPQEFQYKEGINAQGEQMGQSLGGVGRWDPNAEGVLEVFSDLRDGRTKVVNGHNRLALAKRLGIPSLRVEEVNATTPASARAAGALSNISAGNGTPFDAAKFIRSTGLTDQAQLQAAGIPLDKGWGRQGLALSKLPPDIFQDAVNGEHRLGRYVALGESGLDEPGMRGAYQVLKQRPKMTEDTFREVLDQAKQQGNVVAPSAQGGLFGDEVLNPMLQRAELVADVRSGLAKDRRLFGFATRNADALSEADATTIDTAAAGQRVADAQQALSLFDTLKNQAGPVGQLLSKGAERIAQGENASIVAKQIQRKIGDSIERELVSSGMKATPQELAPPPPPPAPIPEPDRAALEAHAIQRAIANGEVRPTEMQPLDLPAAPSADIGAAQRELAAMDPTLPLEEQLPNMPATRQAAADELRLAAEHARQDAEIAWAAEKAAREAEGYDLLSLEEKKAQGLGAEWVEPGSADEIFAEIDGILADMRDRGRRLARESQNALNESAGLVDQDMLQGPDMIVPGPRAVGSVTPEVLPPEPTGSIADIFEQQMRKMAESDARLYRRAGKAFGNLRQGLDALDALDAGQAKQIASEVSGAPEFTLPPELAKASPRYGRKTLQFESDLDRAAYVLANDRTKGESKSAAQFRDALVAAGFDPDQVAAHGKTVKAAVKAVTRDTSGETVVVPVQEFASGRPRLPLPEQQRQIEGTRAQIDDLQQKLNEGGCGT